eukprot:TRINITY_DN5753_c0_g1_i1.p1 TRINITY_DN5753_c0_g1~~TRINITY_DN5753_c0_g1_i1.p1  ORF type:complete len:70 (+),score=3.83 TRINITY_DN5753_c0_g1_i1:317-526(+)
MISSRTLRRKSHDFSNALYGLTGPKSLKMFCEVETFTAQRFVVCFVAVFVSQIFGIQHSVIFLESMIEA